MKGYKLTDAQMNYLLEHGHVPEGVEQVDLSPSEIAIESARSTKHAAEASFTADDRDAVGRMVELLIRQVAEKPNDPKGALLVISGAALSFWTLGYSMALTNIASGDRRSNLEVMRIRTEAEIMDRHMSGFNGATQPEDGGKN